MSKQVFKYRVRSGGYGEPIEVLIPSGAKLIHFGLDALDHKCIWAEVPVGTADETWYLRLFVTGEIIPDEGEHQGTLITKIGGELYHLYRFPTADAARG